MTLPKKTWPFADGALLVTRVTADNPGPLTGPGTNAYVVRAASGGPAAVIDPGPDDAAHRAALVAEAGGEVAAILATHTHLDHTAGAASLAAATGALVYAFGRHGEGVRPAYAALLAELAAADNAVGGGEGADLGFAPDRRLSDGQAVGASGALWALRAVRTPGHIANHLAFGLETADGRGLGAAFSGDHVMAWATSLVSPPDGDMRAYMQSLDGIGARRDRLLLPGHGDAIDDPAARIAELRTHRLARRAGIEAALASGPKQPAEIRAIVYEGLAPGLEAMADRNVLAHLLELTELGRAKPLDPVSATARFAAPAL